MEANRESACKLNFTKAYNHFSSSFLYHHTERMGFGGEIEILDDFVTSDSFVVIVNGGPPNSFLLLGV